jgi:hypothetical protein
LQVDAGRDLGHGHAVAVEPQHTAFGDVENLLALRDRAGTRERHLLDLADELLDFSLPGYRQRAVGDFESGASGEVARKDNAPGPRGDVDKAAGTCGHMRARAEF